MFPTSGPKGYQSNSNRKHSKQPSHVKLVMTYSCWQTHIGVCEQHNVVTVGENRDKFYLSPTVCQHVVVLFSHFNLTSWPTLVWCVKATLDFLNLTLTTHWAILYTCHGGQCIHFCTGNFCQQFGLPWQANDIADSWPSILLWWVYNIAKLVCCWLKQYHTMKVNFLRPSYKVRLSLTTVVCDFCNTRCLRQAEIIYDSSF